MINTNDLTLLRYGWGYRPGDGSGLTDCFQLACEVHRRLGYSDYSAEFEWVYEKYTDKTLPRTQIAKWLLQNGTILSRSVPGAVVLLPASSGAALGTLLEDGSSIVIGPLHNVVRARIPESSSRMFWMNR